MVEANSDYVGGDASEQRRHALVAVVLVVAFLTFVYRWLAVESGSLHSLRGKGSVFILIVVATGPSASWIWRCWQRSRGLAGPSLENAIPMALTVLPLGLLVSIWYNVGFDGALIGGVGIVLVIMVIPWALAVMARAQSSSTG